MYVHSHYYCSYHHHTTEEEKVKASVQFFLLCELLTHEGVERREGEKTKFDDEGGGGMAVVCFWVHSTPLGIKLLGIK